ncbi:MAG: hypothetical protein JW797_05255 [Bradymonadales bacterium]|nr:hypothetical protein [Bradymonadales bacterium]
MISSKYPFVMLVATSVLLTATALADPPTQYQNGDVLIGSRAQGADLPDSDEPDRRLLVVIDSPYQVFAEAGTFIHVAAWTPDGTPARGARVYLAGHLIGRTDETGTLAFRWGIPGSGVDSYWVNGSLIQVRWDHQGHSYGGQVWFSAFSRTQSFASDHLYVYTDRGIYNPGQVIHIRSIGWHLGVDFIPLENATVEVLLSDPGGRPIGGGNVTTDAFGVAATDITLSEQAEEGMYELVASYAGATASTRLRIERFVPPVINIEHTLGRFLTRDQEEIAFEVTLGYFTGGEFRQGSLTLDVLVDGASRYHQVQELNGPGPHPVAIGGSELAAIRQDLVEGQRLEVQLAVEDPFGRRDQLSRELHYTVNPYIAIIEKDRDYYSTGDSVELVVRLTDRERVPVRNTEVTLVASTGQRLVATTDNSGTAQFSLTMGDSTFSVEVFLAGVESALAYADIWWQELQPMRSHIADAIIEENQAAQVSVRFPSGYEPAESVVHMDVVDTSGSLVNSVLIPIRHQGGSYLAEGSFTAPSWGSMLLTFFCLGRQVDDRGRAGENETRLGLMTEGQNLVVHPGRELRVELQGIGEEVAPGADYQAQIQVFDRQGNPVEAAIGVAMVDRAVISLKDPLEITPMDHFYNPELRVISTTGSAILTWPVVSRNWGYRQMDIALPPFPYLEEGPIASPEMTRGGIGTLMMAGSMAADGEMAEMAMPMVASPPPQAMGPEGEVYEAMMAEEMEAGRMSSDGRPLVERSAAEPPVVITIRTEFPETSLWMPFLYTEGGAAVVQGSMPDTITVQEMAIVASSQAGNVGVLRYPVRVTQPLFVRSDLPDTLTVGDALDARVAVQNLTAESQQVTVRLESPEIQVDQGPVTVTVDPNSTAVAVFPVVAQRAGRHPYTITAQSAERQDVEQREIWVRPAGLPLVSSYTPSRVEGQTRVFEVEIPRGGQWTTAVLNVAFPAISSAFAGLDALETKLMSGDLWSLGGELIATALLYEYRLRGEGPGQVVEQMRQALQMAVGELVSAQQPDGGWGFWWHGKSSPYITAYCVEALSLLSRLGFSVPPVTLQQAVNYLVDVQTGDLYDVSDIAFWEGQTEAVRLGITAEIFSVLTAVPDTARTQAWFTAMMRMGAYFTNYLDTDTPEVMAYAHAVLGLHRLNGTQVVTTDPDRLLQAARRLNDLRREGHWEPSWFNAYGGTIEATVAVLEVFQELGGELLAGDMRQVVRYLLSTRDEWGGWHNPRGTAAAIRGMLILVPEVSEIPSVVEVQVADTQVASVDLDPADPYLSGISLSALDLTSALSPGRQVVRVRYTGNLDPDMRLTVRHWGPRTEAVAGLVRLEANAVQTTVALGDLVDYRLRVESTTSTPRLVQVEIAAPANTEFDRPSVQGLRERGLVESYGWTDAGLRLILQLEGEATRDLDLRLVAVRSGQAAMPAVVATVLNATGEGEGGQAVAVLDRTLSVR